MTESKSWPHDSASAVVNYVVCFSSILVRRQFYDQETLNGRAILVRFVISEITANSCHFEQAFSDDGGKTWEVNWIATDTKVKD